MIPNPFASDIFPDGFPLSSEENLTQLDALEDLEAQILTLATAPAAGFKATVGRVVQLKAPRAGYGKSHLLGRLRQRLKDRALVLPVEYDPDREFRWSGVFWEMLQNMHGSTSQGSGVTLLDELGRRTFARLNKVLIRQGRVPCAEPENAMAAMEDRALELFDLSNERQPVGRWFAEHFERLLPGISAELAAEVDISETAAANWLRILCSYTQGLTDTPAVRFENLRWAAYQGQAAPVSTGGMQVVQMTGSGDAYFKDRLAEFGRMASLWRPLVFIFDDLDAVHGNADQVIRLASIMAEMRRLLPRTLVVFSLNQDLWTHSFQKFLPTALEDRLSSSTIQLAALGREDAESLIQHRLLVSQVPSSMRDEFLKHLNLPDLFHREPQRAATPRLLLRWAARVWENVIQRRLPENEAPTSSAAESSPGLLPGAKLPRLKEALGKLTPLVSKHEEPSTLLHAEGGFLKIDPTKPVPVATSKTPILAPSISAKGPPAPPTPLKLTPLAPLVAQATAAQASTKEDPWQKCQQLRAKLADSDSLKIDQDILCHLLEAGGRHLTLVSSSHVAIPGSPGPGALRWLTPDGEIFFGSESYADKAYWKALIQHLKDKSFAPTPAGPSWVVVFSTSSALSPLRDWVSEDEANALEKSCVNLLRLDHAELAAIYAMDEVLHESEQVSGNLPTPLEVFATLSPMADNFWKKVTRPLV